MHRNELPFEPRHTRVPSGAAKTISGPMVRMMQAIHLSYTETNTISKMIKTRFYMTHVTKVFHQVRPNRFLRLWYVWCKLWIYLAPILKLSPNGPKQDSTWPTSPRSSIGCVHNDFLAYGTFGANHAPILNQDYHSIQMDRNELPFEPHHLGVPSGASKTISEAMVHLPQTVHLLALKLTMSPNGPKCASIWASSHRSTIQCIQNNFWAYGTFGANRAPILHRN
jgi:hypothetical protein